MAHYVIGRKCKLYYDVAGVGLGTYIEGKIVKNPSLALSKDKGEIDNRESDYTRSLPGQKKAPLSIELDPKIGNAFWTALKNAWINDTIIGIAVASGNMTVVGEEVFEADYYVFDFPINQPLSESGSTTIELDLAADSDTEPSYYDVAA